MATNGPQAPQIKAFSQAENSLFWDILVKLKKGLMKPNEVAGELGGNREAGQKFAAYYKHVGSQYSNYVANESKISSLAQQSNSIQTQIDKTNDEIRSDRENGIASSVKLASQ